MARPVSLSAPSTRGTGAPMTEVEASSFTLSPAVRVLHQPHYMKQLSPWGALEVDGRRVHPLPGSPRQDEDHKVDRRDELVFLRSHDVRPVVEGHNGSEAIRDQCEHRAEGLARPPCGVEGRPSVSSFGEAPVTEPRLA